MVSTTLKYYDSPDCYSNRFDFLTALHFVALPRDDSQSHNLRQYRPRWIVHPFGFFFLRDGNGDCDNDHGDDHDDDNDGDGDDVDVDETEPNVEKDRRE